MAVDAENNILWADYFAQINTVCPWSLSYYRKNGIDIVEGLDPQPLGDLAARIYLVPRMKIRLLKKRAGSLQRTRPEELWFFSYPGYGENATPVRCLIQQDRNRLETIRNNLNPNLLDK
jgi:hypothetical protein